MHFPDIKKFSLYEDDGTNTATILNEVMPTGKPTTQATKKRVIKYFMTNKENGTAHMAKMFKLSVDTIHRIIDNEMNTRHPDFLKPLIRVK